MVRLGEMPDTCCAIGCQNSHRKGEKDLFFYCIPSSLTVAEKTKRKRLTFIL